MPVAVLTLLVLSALSGRQSEVKLPLREYLDLVERAEAAERAAADAAARTEPAVADLVSQSSSLVWQDMVADVTTRFEVVSRGVPTRPVALPVTGLPFRVEITPAGSAAVQPADGGLELVAPEPGRYEVTVQSRARLDAARGVTRLALAPMAAPVGDIALDLPADRIFSCQGAVIAEDQTRDDLRHLRFAVPRGKPAVVEVRRDLQGDDAEALLAATVVVTIIDLRRDGPVRHDVVLYEVARGQMRTFEVELPEGLEIESATTDEGDSPVLVEAGVLRVERTTLLAGTGHLMLTSRPDALETIALDPVIPTTPPRAHYLAIASSVAAEATPIPEPSWLRVDLQDLPQTIRPRIASAGLQAAWRRDATEGPLQLRVAPVPPASTVDTVVKKRDSLTLLTAEGTILHRDTFAVQSAASAFPVKLPEGATLWSVLVNGLAVRPIERNGTKWIPLGLGSSGAETVEVVAVQERAIPEGKSTLELGLAKVVAPVLEHEWRLMLPVGNRYRYVTGDLEPPPEESESRGSAGRFGVENASRVTGLGGSSGIWGRVTDERGSVLPGATVYIASEQTGWSSSVDTDRNGGFWFAHLPAGTYTIEANLSGFQTEYFSNVEIVRGVTSAFRITLGLATVAESITVPGPPPPLSPSEEEEMESAEYGRQARLLKQGLVGGVKPVSVTIPESGKILTLAGVLPPSDVRVGLEVKTK